MISQEENDVLTRVGPGTACGDLMRRYWQPAALVEELPVGSAPLPIRLLGEDLVLYRDDRGRSGLLGLHCSHRGADLSYGRVEDGGLRCIYHGWLYDLNGRCLEQPGEPAGSMFHEKILHRAYPCVEAGGMVLAYMGPGEPPLVPSYEFLTVSDEHRFATKIYHECNYLQSLEGNLDPTHVPFLHAMSRNSDGSAGVRRHVPSGMEVEQAEFGARLFRTSLQQGHTHARITNFVLPDISAIPAGSDEGYTVNWHVPIDDTHHWKYVCIFNRNRPLDADEVRGQRSEMADGYRLTRTLGNHHLQDREQMQTRTFSGLGFGFQAHDAAATETQGPIQQRTQEHLGTGDAGVLAIRKSIRQAIEMVQAGREPPQVIRGGAEHKAAAVVVTNAMLPPDADGMAFLRESVRQAEQVHEKVR
ncbi:MAG TPA: aromatic ring-hydroxylating dioxygenase subunit alpha [Chloroflexota bacterium]